MWTFGRVAAEGTRLAKAGKVKLRSVACPEGGDLEITALVTDGQMTPYEATVTLQRKEGERLTVLSRCPCSAGVYCKHAAAILAYACEAQGQEAIEQRAKEPFPSVLPHSEPQLPSAPSHRMTRMHLPSSPQPMLVLRRVDASLPRAQSTKRLRLPVAEALVTYEGCPDRLSLLQRTASHQWSEGELNHMLMRDMEEERTLLRQLMRLGFLSFMEAHPAVTTATPERHLAVSGNYELEFWKEFRLREAPGLQKKGWQLEIAPDFGFDVVQIHDEDWILELETKGALYSLEMGIQIEGQRISLIPILADALQRGLCIDDVLTHPDEPFLFVAPELGDRIISLPGRRLGPILTHFHELLTPSSKKKDRLKVDCLRVVEFGQTQGLTLSMPAELERLSDRLSSFSELPAVAPPAGLQATLRPYQQDGLNWLQFLREYDLHGILADDMGLGKTVQTIAHLLTEVESGRADRPSLILAPTSVLYNWSAEIRKFAPTLKVMMLRGDNRHERIAYLQHSHVVITSYPLLIRDIEKLQTQLWHLVVLDEAHGIKNARAKAAQAARELQARHRLCLTGTPMENHLGELWSLFHFLMPGLLGEQDAFRACFRNPIEKKRDATAQQRLTARLQPVLLRRTKDKVAKDLPPKTEIIQTIELDAAQADLYETIRSSVDKRVQHAIAEQGLEKSQLIVLDALLKLRQVCCHPALLKIESAQKMEASAKTDFLLDQLLPDLVEEGRRILLFSQFTEMLALLEHRVEKMGLPYLKLTGATTNREKPVRQFQDGEAPLFLISLKAGGVGLNLTAADTVIHYDPWWNPAAESQATDRAHRLGQTKPVFVHKLICKGTIEERIVEMQRRKSALVTSLLTGTTDALKLTQEDVKELLSPV